MPKTSSPTAKRVTPTPTASTTPATSQPTHERRLAEHTTPPRPRARVFQSTGLTPGGVHAHEDLGGQGLGRRQVDGSSTSGGP